MKIVNGTFREFLNNCFIIVLVSGTIGIALKFLAYFNHWVYFPYFPNIIDSMFLVISAVYLGSRAFRKVSSETD